MRARRGTPRPGSARAGGRRRRAGAGTLGLLVIAAGLSWPWGGAAHAQPAAPPAAVPPVVTRGPALQAHAAVSPAIAQLGQPLVYRGWVLRPGARAFARWLAPDTSEALTWGEPAVRQGRRLSGSLGRGDERRRRQDATGRHELGGMDTLFVEIPLQAFALGRLTIPGVPIEIDDGRGPNVVRLPTVRLDVMPVLTAADSNADYRGLHAPLAAPWWERVPWTWVALGLLGLAGSWVAVRLWRRRRGGVPAPAPAALPLDARAEALAALAALRGLSLPEQGRFAEHAFRLGQILRRYLEAATGVTRPGDSTPELVAHLRNAGLAADDLARLSALLRVWDQVKFAREPFTRDEAVRAERAVESYVRRPAIAAEKVA